MLLFFVMWTQDNLNPTAINLGLEKHEVITLLFLGVIIIED